LFSTASRRVGTSTDGIPLIAFTLEWSALSKEYEHLCSLLNSMVLRHGLPTLVLVVVCTSRLAETKEKVHIIAGPKFGELQGHTLTIHKKAFYGL
jgi:hypothetical protein